MEQQSQTTESTQTRKFLFDLAFDNGMNKKASECEKPKPTYSQEHLDAEKQLSYEQGVQAGQKAMMEDQQQYMNVLLSQISQSLGHVIEASAHEWQKQLTQLQELSLVIMKKILPNYVEKNGLQEVEAIVSKVISEVSREPRLVFRVNESMFDEISVKINDVAASQAYAGKIVILGDPALGISDCRIEWADGGIERDVKTIWSSIEKVMSEVESFETSLIHPETPPEITETISKETASVDSSLTNIDTGDNT
jgi:flagellar assembly protein FliH